MRHGQSWRTRISRPLPANLHYVKIPKKIKQRSRVLARAGHCIGVTDGARLAAFLFSGKRGPGNRD